MTQISRFRNLLERTVEQDAASAILQTLDIIFDEGVDCFTVSTTEIRINPESMKDFSDDEIIMILRHEAQHLLRGHLQLMEATLRNRTYLESILTREAQAYFFYFNRNDNYDRMFIMLFNTACDLEVNLSMDGVMLRNAKGPKIGENGFKFFPYKKGDTAKEFFKVLVNNPYWRRLALNRINIRGQHEDHE